MSNLFTEDERRTVRALADGWRDGRDDDDLLRRREVAERMRERVDAIGVPRGETLTRRELCELLSLQRQAPMTRPLLRQTR